MALAFSARADGITVDGVIDRLCATLGEHSQSRHKRCRRSAAVRHRAEEAASALPPLPMAERSRRSSLRVNTAPTGRNGRQFLAVPPLSGGRSGPEHRLAAIGEIPARLRS